MSLSIRNNLMSNVAQKNFGDTYEKMSSSVNSLSSGLRINDASDDAAGLAIREDMRAEIGALDQGVRNANDGVSMLQTYDGAAQVVDNKLVRMKELAEQSATGTYDDDQRDIMQDEFKQLSEEIDRIAETTDFNGISGISGGASYLEENLNEVGVEDGDEVEADQLVAVGSGAGIDDVNSGDIVQVSGDLDSATEIQSVSSDDLEVVHSAEDGDWVDSKGTDYQWDADNTTWDDSEDIPDDAGSITVHFGPGKEDGDDNYDVDVQNMTAEGLGVKAGTEDDELDISDQEGAKDALEEIDSAIKKKDEGRAHFGAMMNRLDYTVDATSTQRENIQAAESQISDVDVASEMADMTRNQVLAQAGTSMLSQANTMPEMAMGLLQQ
ncbi:MAG: flagellin [Candidatus Brocadiia bacterium]